MAKAILDKTTSVLGFAQGEAWAYQPAVTNNETVTTWAWTGLPDGVEADAETGLIFGAAKQKGVYLIRLVAKNATGDSDPLIIPVGIYPRTWMNDGAVPVNIDVRSGVVYPPRIAGWKIGDPVAFGKDGDTLVLDIGFSVDDGNTLTPIEMETMRCGVKATDSGQMLAQSDGDFTQIGDMDTTRYRVLVPLVGSGLRGALSEYEDDAGTAFTALAEIEWKQLVEYVGTRVTVTRSTRNFAIRIGRQLVK